MHVIKDRILILEAGKALLPQGTLTIHDFAYDYILLPLFEPDV